MKGNDIWSESKNTFRMRKCGSPNIVWPNESDSILNAFRMLVALTFGHSLFLICSNECFDHKSYFNIKPNNNAFKLVGFSFRPKPRREVRIYHSMWYAVQSRAPCYCVCVCAMHCAFEYLSNWIKRIDRPENDSRAWRCRSRQIGPFVCLYLIDE